MAKRKKQIQDTMAPWALIAPLVSYPAKKIPTPIQQAWAARFISACKLVRQITETEARPSEYGDIYHSAKMLAKTFHEHAPKARPPIQVVVESKSCTNDFPDTSQFEYEETPRTENAPQLVHRFQLNFPTSKPKGFITWTPEIQSLKDYSKAKAEVIALMDAWILFVEGLKIDKLTPDKSVSPDAVQGDGAEAKVAPIISLYPSLPWSKIALTILDNNSMQIEMDGNLLRQTYSFADLGMKDNRHKSPRPSKAWDHLCAFARGNGSTKIERNDAGALNKKLIEIFGAMHGDKPIEWVNDFFNLPKSERERSENNAGRRRIRAAGWNCNFQIRYQTIPNPNEIDSDEDEIGEMFRKESRA